MLLINPPFNFLCPEPGLLIWEVKILQNLYRLNFRLMVLEFLGNSLIALKNTFDLLISIAILEEARSPIIRLKIITILKQI